MSFVPESGWCYLRSPLVYEVTFLEIMANGSLDRLKTCIYQQYLQSSRYTEQIHVFESFYSSRYGEVTFLTN